jgi:hypothetical protein
MKQVTNWSYLPTLPFWRSAMEVIGHIMTFGIAGSVCLPRPFPMSLSEGNLGRTFFP